MTHVTEDIWFVCMDKSTLVTFAIRTFRPLMALICTNEKYMELCTKVINKILYIQNSAKFDAWAIKKAYQNLLCNKKAQEFQTLQFSLNLVI
jgi:hypothetical protein